MKWYLVMQSIIDGFRLWVEGGEGRGGFLPKAWYLQDCIALHYITQYLNVLDL